MFHFLTDPVDQKRYLQTLDASLRPGGIAIIATFDLAGPERCSNLPVERYSPQTLAAQIDHLMPDLFDVIHAVHHAHHTPLGNTQTFQISVFRKKGTKSMKNFKVFGPGCAHCATTETMVKEAAAKLGVDVTVEKVTDAKSIAMAGVMSTPGIAVDGKLVHAGGLPDAAKLEGWLQA